MASQQKLRKKKFNKLLLEAIDEAFSSLGEPAKEVLYSILETAYGVNKRDIPRRVAGFSVALGKIFGPGARRLEILAMKNLHAKIEVNAKWPVHRWLLPKGIVPELTFQEYVKLMRHNFEAKNENKTEMGILLGEQEELRH